jgi:hypothetical protein
MGKETIEGLVTVITAIVGVALVATLVSKNANTSAVVAAGGTSLATALTAAEAPVTQTASGGLSSIGWTGSAPIDLGSM